MTTPNGTSSVNAYDHLGRLVQTTQPSVTLYDGTQQAPTATLGYDGDGHVITSTDGAGDLTQDSYDPLGRLVATVNPVGATTLYTYTATTLSAVQDAAGHVTTYNSDPAGRRTSATDPLGTTTQQYAYDGVGNTVAITTPLDYTHPNSVTVESRQYNALDAVITDTVAGSGEVTPTTPQVTTWRYDHDGNAVQVQTPATVNTATTFDLADRRTQITVLPAPPAVQMLTLDAADNLTQQVDFSARTHTLTLDGADRLLQQIDTCPTCYYATPITTTATYDPDGNVVSLSQQGNGLSAGSAATYTALDQLSSQDDGWGATQYGYDAAGRLRTATLPGGTEVITHTLDAAGRATSINDTLADPVAGLSTSTSQFTYTPTNLPLTDTLPGSVTEGRSYDADNRLTQVQTQGTGFRITDGYAFDAHGQTNALTITTNSGQPLPETLNHDALGRVSADLDTNGTLWQYGYDPTDNLLQIGQGAQPSYVTYAYTYAATGGITPATWLPNELVASWTNGQRTTYGYDLAGDTTAITAPNSLQYSLYYDAAGRFGGAVRQDSSTQVGVQITYNARGLRASYAVVQAGQQQPPPPLFTELFRYRGDQVSQVIVSGTATTPFTETFVYRPDGSPLELLYQSQDGHGANLATVRYGYVLDGQGSVVALTDSTGAAVDTYRYDAWGALSPCPNCETVHQPLRYRGYWYDGWDDSLSPGTWNNGPLPWYWLTTRSYAPALKRFLQPDPSAQDGVRSYVYCHDDPADCADPSGLAGDPAGPSEVGPQWLRLPGAGLPAAAQPFFQEQPLLLPAPADEGLTAGLDTGDVTTDPLANFNENEAAAEAEAARANLGYRPADKVVAAIQRGLRTVSGWKTRFPGEGMARSVTRRELGFEDPVELQVLENATLRGYKFATDEDADQGTPGRAAASHAEPQLDYLAPGEPQATSWRMCDSCVDYFRFQAMDTGVPRIVAEPRSVLVFYPDGSIVVRGPIGRYVFHLDGTIERP